MKIHEYQGKQIFKKYGVPVPRGIVAKSPSEAEHAAKFAGSQAAKRQLKRLRRFRRLRTSNGRIKASFLYTKLQVQASPSAIRRRYSTRGLP